MQTVMSSSKKQFTIMKQGDPVEFMSWVLNTLHFELTGGKVKKRSVITDNLQGEIQVTTEKGSGKAKEVSQLRMVGFRPRYGVDMGSM
jgi:U4/U6.U5 tri-snRNP-associated protein 2